MPEPPPLPDNVAARSDADNTAAAEYPPLPPPGTAAAATDPVNGDAAEYPPLPPPDTATAVKDLDNMAAVENPSPTPALEDDAPPLPAPLEPPQSHDILGDGAREMQLPKRPVQVETETAKPTAVKSPPLKKSRSEIIDLTLSPSPMKSRTWIHPPPKKVKVEAAPGQLQSFITSDSSTDQCAKQLITKSNIPMSITRNQFYKIRSTKRASRGTYTESRISVSVYLSLQVHMFTGPLENVDR